MHLGRKCSAEIGSCCCCCCCLGTLPSVQHVCCSGLASCAGAEGQVVHEGQRAGQHAQAQAQGGLGLRAGQGLPQAGRSQLATVRPSVQSQDPKKMYRLPAHSVTTLPACRYRCWATSSTAPPRARCEQQPGWQAGSVLPDVHFLWPAERTARSGQPCTCLSLPSC